MRSLIGLLLVFGGVSGFRAMAQDHPGDWQAKAGGKMSFEVASVKPSKTPIFANFNLLSDDAKAPGGRLTVGLWLAAYIRFAYKLAPYQFADAIAHAPKWVATDIFEIDASAPGNPTKDQMRLMMQSLLADRFKLAVHFETRDVPVLALTQVKAGKLGPKLNPHSEGPACPDQAVQPSPLDTLASRDAMLRDPKAVFPPVCDIMTARGWPDGVMVVGSRNTTMVLVAEAISNYGSLQGALDRPVLDQTGLDGRFDFALAFKQDESNRLGATTTADAPPPAPEVAPL
jgi:bla regulator protein blaR1